MCLTSVGSAKMKALKSANRVSMQNISMQRSEKRLGRKKKKRDVIIGLIGQNGDVLRKFSMQILKEC